MSNTAFFYGTLMSPAVLHRVTGAPPARPSSTTDRTKPHYITRPALLPAHRRRRVLHADYPAVTPASPEDSVRGTYVTGLSDNDVFRLDRFEGDEYRREKVRVRILPEATKTAVEKGDAALGASCSSENSDHTHSSAESASGRTAAAEGEEWADTQTYIWIAPASELEESEWDFDEFVRTKLWRWSGASEEFAAVDELDSEQQQQRDPTGGRQYFDGRREEESVQTAV